jgi:hypothetical protein
MVHDKDVFSKNVMVGMYGAVKQRHTSPHDLNLIIGDVYARNSAPDEDLQ